MRSKILLVRIITISVIFLPLITVLLFFTLTSSDNTSSALDQSTIEYVRTYPDLPGATLVMHTGAVKEKMYDKSLKEWVEETHFPQANISSAINPEQACFYYMKDEHSSNGRKIMFTATANMEFRVTQTYKKVIEREVESCAN